jgi:hypothetical protein
MPQFYQLSMMTHLGLRKRGVEVKKPVCVLEYSQQMGGVDLKDQKLQPYILERKRSQIDK